MPLSKLVFKPGINRDQTNYASEGGWFDCDKIRFRSGFPEKIGGWRVTSLSAYVGTARSLYAWNGLNGVSLVAIGTNSKVYAVAGGTLYNITPLRTTFTGASVTNALSFSSGSNILTINITGHGAVTGDWVEIVGAVDTGGIAAYSINREFEVTKVDANQITVNLGSFVGTGYINGTELTITGITSGLLNIGDPVTGTGVTSGTYVTNILQDTTLPYSYTVNNSQTVSTTTISCQATSTVTGTPTEVQFEIPAGYADMVSGYYWGAGTWGRKTWGSGTDTPDYFPPQLVNFDNYVADLYFNIAGGDIYYWAYSGSYNRAELLSAQGGAVAVPQQVTKVLFANTGHLMAFGCTEYDATAGAPDYLGPYNPLHIRWANVDRDVGPQPEVWKPELTNNAGGLWLQNGSAIVTAIRTRQEILVFTHSSLHSIQFVGGEEVFSQQELSNHITIVGPNVVAGSNNITYWMGTHKFYVYSGRVDTLPCTLRSYVFDNINHSLDYTFFAGSNAQFNEVVWFYASADSNVINRYVVYNYAENIWYFGTIERTAWLDSSNENPIATHDGWLYMHEFGHDAGQPNGEPPLPIEAYIQSADVDIDDGDRFVLIRRVIPDVNFTSSDTANYFTGEPITPEVEITVNVRNFPGAAQATENAEGQTLNRNVTTATATIDQYTNQVFIRARGRQMSFKISSDTIGTQWQLGMPRVDARPDGLRG